MCSNKLGEYLCNLGVGKDLSKQNPKCTNCNAKTAGLWPYPQEMAFPPGHQPQPCPPSDSWALSRLAAWPTLPVGAQEGAACNASLISPSPRPPRPCRHEVRAGDVMRVGGRRKTVEGSERGQGLLAKLLLPFQGGGGRQSRPLRGWGW